MLALLCEVSLSKAIAKPITNALIGLFLGPASRWRAKVEAGSAVEW